MLADESLWDTVEVDANGYFQFDSLKPGKYVIGIRLPGAPSWKYASAAGVPPPAASLYYPGVQNRSAAAAIVLRTDEKRDNIDFTVPAQ